MSVEAAPEVESHAISAPQRVGVKVFVEDQGGVRPGTDDRCVSPLDSGGPSPGGHS